MLGPDEHAERILHLVQQWVAKAENDLKNATHTLQLGEAGPLDTVCFHAQQCTEKYLKALLCFHEIEFSRTHDISALAALLPAHLQPDLSTEEQARLGDYAVAMRYPGDYEPVSLEEARKAVQIVKSRADLVWEVAVGAATGHPIDHKAARRPVLPCIRHAVKVTYPCRG